jgi:hypothetical protein
MMHPIEVVTLARFNLRIAQENLAAVRKNWFWPQMVRICEQKVLAAIDRRAKARRQYALDRNELREATTAPRQPAAGATSFPVKVAAPEDRVAIDAFLEARKGS